MFDDIKKYGKNIIILFLCGLMCVLICVKCSNTSLKNKTGKPQVTPKIISKVTAAPDATPRVITAKDAQGKTVQMVVDNRALMHDYDITKVHKTENKVTYDDPEYKVRQGVDVSKYNGKIDWEKVKKAGYDFVFIRLGYRGYGQSGSLNTDEKYEEYIKGALASGMDVGVYFFSQAINENEAVEEAEYCIERLKNYDITFPVVFDPENILTDTARTDNVTGEQFTKNTIAFCEKIKAAGYTTMVYSNFRWQAEKFDMAKLSEYNFWYAEYDEVFETPYSFEIWQYSETGKVDGIENDVDMNVMFEKAG